MRWAARCCFSGAATPESRSATRTASATCAAPPTRWPSTSIHRRPTAYGNLAENLRGLGDMPAADAAYITAIQWADRLARTDSIDWIATEQAYQAYHAADWDTAQRLLAEVDSSNQYTNAAVRNTRGRIALARGRTEEALTDANAITDLRDQRQQRRLPLLRSRPGSALPRRRQPRRGRTHACERFLRRWQRIRRHDQPLDRAVRDRTDPRQCGPPPRDPRRGAAAARSMPLARRSAADRRGVLLRSRHPL